jgi:hypothetical protein
MTLVDLQALFAENDNQTKEKCNFVTKTQKNVTTESLIQQRLQAKSYKVTKVTKKITDFNSDKKYWFEMFEERASIYQFDGNLSKIDSEVKALDEIIIKYLEGESDGES